jgi:NAD(P)-dependent dehydrogenase (short-subunit alcohol dehydrogenase family)
MTDLPLPHLPLKDRVALVTGASRGIGKALALELAKLGAHCVLVARTQGGLEETDDAIRTATGRGATLLPFDLQRQEKELDMLGPSIVERFGRLDILVHNAGALNRLTPVAHIEPKDWAEVVAVNMTASWRLIRSCDPPLRASDAGRAVFLTSGAAARHRAYWGMYGATKAGMEHLVLTWAEEVAKTPLRVNLASPGAVATKMRGQAFPGEDPASIAQPADVAPALAALCLPSETRHGEIVALQPAR